MKRLRFAVGAVINLADWLSGLCLIAITLINLAAVFMRYVMLDSIPWSEEVMRYGAVWLTFLAAAAASWRNEHLSLDLVMEVGGPTFQKCHRALVHLLCAGFAGIVLWQGIVYCLRNGMQTAPTTGMLMVYAYAALAVGGALILIVELAKTVDALLPASTQEPGEVSAP